MTLLLLCVIYIAFIGLGLPDSLFGTAWPAIYGEFALPLSAANCVTLIVSGGTVISSAMSARVINKFGTYTVTAVSTALTAAALFGFSVSKNLIWLCLFSIPLGIGAGAVDSALNNYVALHFSASHMNFLHCFYGVGVSVSPYIMSFALSGGNWRGGYRTAFIIQCVITAVIAFSRPLWKKSDKNSSEEEKSVTLSFAQMIKTPCVKSDLALFASSCAIECTCGAWSSTFLVESKGFSADVAAKTVAMYFVGLTLGRFLSGVLSSKISSWNLIKSGLIIVFSAIIVLLLPLKSTFAALGLFLLGLGIGPVYPNIMHLTPKNFGKDVSQSIIGLQMAVAYTGITAVPPIFGFLAQKFGMKLFAPFMLVLFVILAISTLFLICGLKKQNRYER